MLNSDSVLLIEDSLEKLIKPLENSEIIATVGRQLPRHDSELWVKKDYAHAFPEDKSLPGLYSPKFSLISF